jgi:hypothetical protein
VIHADVDARVAVEIEGAIGPPRDALEPFLVGRVERRTVGGDAVGLLILGAPLRSFSRNVPLTAVHAGERHLPRRQHVDALVPQHADVHLAAVDVLLDDRRGAQLLVNELCPAGELLLVLDDRRLRDAGRRFEEQRFDDQREAETLRQRKPMTRTDHHELGNRDAMVGEQLLRQRLVARENQAARIASRVGEVKQLEITDDVLIEGGDAGKRLHEIEDDVRLEVTCRGRMPPRSSWMPSTRTS